MTKKSKLLEQVRLVIRTKHYAYSTEKTYVDWIYRFIIFHNKKHPRDMGGQEISEFLTNLTNKRKVSAATQNQALNAIVFLFKEVLEKPLNDFHFKHARSGKRVPVGSIFSRLENQGSIPGQGN